MGLSSKRTRTIEQMHFRFRQKSSSFGIAALWHLVRILLKSARVTKRVHQVRQILREFN